jgi:hypothetical protein
VFAALVSGSNSRNATGIDLGIEHRQFANRAEQQCPDAVFSVRIIDAATR